MIALADLRWHLRVEHDADDDLIRQYEAAAVRTVEDLAGRYFGTPEVVTETFSLPRYERILLLRDPALAEDLSVSPNIAAPLVEKWNGTAYDIVDEADYVVEGDRLIHLDEVWPIGFRSVRVTYWRGYTAGDEPDDIRAAVMQIATVFYEHRLPVGETVGEKSLVPFTAKEIVGRYRKVRA